LPDQKINWTFDGDQIPSNEKGAYQNIQHTRFNIPHKLINCDLSQHQGKGKHIKHWKLEVQANSDRNTFANLGIQMMALAGGDQSALLLSDKSSADGGTWANNVVTFNLNSNLISSYLNYIPAGDKDFSAVKQFTIQPYQEHIAATNEYHGARSIVVTIGPEGGYTPEAGWQTVQASGLTTVDKLSNLQLAEFSHQNLQGKTYEVYVGAIANFLLGGGTTALGNWDQSSSVHLDIDERIDTSQHLLNQSIVYSESGKNDWKTVALDFDKQIFVSGVGYIDGFAQLQKPLSKTITPVEKFQNATLDLQSSYGKGHPTAAWAIDVSGITVKYPPKRDQGTIALNAFTPSVEWQDSSGKTGRVLWKAQLGNAISASESKTYATNPLGMDAEKRKTGRVHAWDNQIIGGWVDASDGIETLAPYSELRRNVFHVNDDAIKVLTSNQIFEQNLIHQGNIGSAISLSGYGYSNGPVTNSNNPKYGIYDTYVHRITQPTTYPGYPGTNVDGFGGLISNRTLFSRALSSDAGMGIFDVTISKVYVPSLAYTTTSSAQGKKEANSVLDIGVFSGLDYSPNSQSPPEDQYKAMQATDTYGLWKFKVDNVKVYPNINAAPYAPQYYFDKTDSGWSHDKKPITEFTSTAAKIPITYTFYGQTKPVNVQIGYSQYTNSTIGLSHHSLLMTGSDDEDQLALPGFWKDRFGQVSDNKNKSTVPCENSPLGTIPAVLFVGQHGQDAYQIEPGVFTAIVDHGAPADRDRLTGIPGRASQWSHFRLGGNDYLLVSKQHPKTKVLLVDPLGRQEAGNRIAKLEFGSGESVGLKKFLNRSNSLGAMTYLQAAQRIGLDVGKSLGLSSEDRLFLAGHTGVDPQQIRFLVGSDHHQDRVGPPIANPPRPEPPNRICGDAGPNILRGTAEVDYIFGLGAADNLYGGADDDKLFGGKGSDTLFGQAGNDFLAGGHGSDSLIGAKGDDWLYGEEGDDFLRGSQGNDYLSGGRGSDQLNGGKGQDVFLVEKNPGRDVIQDFNLDDDKIVLGAGIQNFNIENRDNDAYLYSGQQELAVVLGAGGKLVQQAHILSGGNESDTLKHYKQLAKDGIDWIVTHPVPHSNPFGVPTPVCPDGTDKCSAIQDRLALIEGATNLRQLNLVAGPSLAMPQYSSGYDGIAPLGTNGSVKYPVCMQFTQSPAGWLGLYGTTKTTRYAFGVMRFSISPDPHAHTAEKVFFNVTGAFDDGSGWHPIPQNVGPATYSCEENGVTTFTYSQQEDGVIAEFRIDENKNMSGTVSYEAKSYTFNNTPNEAPKYEGKNGGCVPVCFGGIGTSYWSYTNMEASMINKRGQLETGIGWFDHQWINTGVPVKLLYRWAFLNLTPTPDFPSPLQWLWLATQITDEANPRFGYQYTGAIDINKDCENCSDKDPVIPLQVGDKFQTTMNRFHKDELTYNVDVKATILETITLTKDGLTQTFPTKYLLAFDEPDLEPQGFKMILSAEPSSNRRGSIDHRVPLVTGLINWEGPGLLYDTDNKPIGQGFLEAMNLMDPNDVLSHAFAINEIDGKVPPPVPYPHGCGIIPGIFKELFGRWPKPTNDPPEPRLEDDHSQKPDPLLAETDPDRDSHSHDHSKPRLQPPGAAPQNGHHPGSLRLALTQKWQRLANRFRPNGP
jgi:hypothetical protein